MNLTRRQAVPAGVALPILALAAGAAGAVVVLADLASLPYLQGLSTPRPWQLVAGVEVFVLALVAPILHGVMTRWEVAALALVGLPVEMLTQAATAGGLELGPLVSARCVCLALALVAACAREAIAAARFTAGECALFAGLLLAGVPLLGGLLTDAGISAGIVKILLRASPVTVLGEDAPGAALGSCLAVLMLWAVALRFAGRRGERT